MKVQISWNAKDVAFPALYLHEDLKTIVLVNKDKSGKFVGTVIACEDEDKSLIGQPMEIDFEKVAMKRYSPEDKITLWNE